MNRFSNINLSALPVLMLVAGTALAGSTKITECGFVIAEPGNYMLVQDLLDCPEGITILSSDVSLDLQGHSIACADGDDPLRAGVILWGAEADPVRNVTVRNGQVSNCHDGVVLVFAEDSKVTRITTTGNRALGGPYSYGTGITVYLSHNNVITHNQAVGNENQGIYAIESSSNVFKHNEVSGNYGEGVLWISSADSQFMCNQIVGNLDGIALGEASTGNLLQGNYSAYNYYSGITVFGEAWDGVIFSPIPGDNTIRLNIAENNYYRDLMETVFDWYFFEYLPNPDGECLNTWGKNRFGTQIAADDCIPASFDLDTVCALDDDH